MANDLLVIGDSAAKRVFDYDSLEPEVANIVRASATEVRNVHDVQIEALVEAGRILTQVKDLLEHGKFIEWIRSECHFTERTAQTYMQVWRNVGPKYETISHLRPTTIYRIAAPGTPPEARRSILAEGPTLSDEEALKLIREVRSHELMWIGTVQKEASKRRRRVKREVASKDPQVRQAADWQSHEVVRRYKHDKRTKWAAASMLAELAGEHRSRMVEILRAAGYSDLAADIALVQLSGPASA